MMQIAKDEEFSKEHVHMLINNLTRNFRCDGYEFFFMDNKALYWSIGYTQGGCTPFATSREVLYFARGYLFALSPWN